MLGAHVERVTAHQEEIRGRLEVQEAASSGLLPRVDEAQRQLEELMTGAHAVPYMAGDGLHFYGDERAGRVLGFRREAGRRTAPTPTAGSRTSSAARVSAWRS